MVIGITSFPQKEQNHHNPPAVYCDTPYLSSSYYQHMVRTSQATSRDSGSSTRTLASAWTTTHTVRQTAILSV